MLVGLWVSKKGAVTITPKLPLKHTSEQSGATIPIGAHVIEASRRKLDEARFFYDHLVEERERMHPLAPRAYEAFRYYFSAFIQAARSVTWTLGNEEPEKWKAWEPKWRATRSNEEQKLLDLTNELRIDEVKRGGANPSLELEEVALHELLRSGLASQHPSYGGHSFAPPDTPPPTTKRHTYYFEDEEGREEVPYVSGT
jgi:hypothetical protein